MDTTLESGRTGPVGYFLAPLLPLATRLADPEVQAQVHSLVGQFLSHPAVTAGARNGFAGACYRLLEEGAWPDAEAAHRALEEVGLREITLKKLAIDPAASIDRARLLQALESSRDLLARDLPAHAGFLLAPLLPLAPRVAEPQLEAEIRETIAALLVHPILAPEDRDGFSRSCEELLVSGAWHDREVGEIVLEGLGLRAAGLDRFVEDAEAAIPPGRLQRALDSAGELLDGPRPQAAGHILKRLLPLAARAAHRGLEAETRALVRRLLKHDSTSERFRQSFARGCQELLNAGAWPDPEEGKKILQDLGLLNISHPTPVQ